MPQVDVPEPAPSPLAALVDLLVRLFTKAAAMSAFVRSFGPTAELASSLPSEVVPAEEMAFAIACRMQERNLVTTHFFAQLARVRPLCVDEIGGVAAAWGIRLMPAIPALGDNPPTSGVMRWSWVAAVGFAGAIAVVVGILAAPNGEPSRAEPSAASGPARTSVEHRDGTAAPAGPQGMVLIPGGRALIGSTPEELRAATSQCRSAGDIPCDIVLSREAPPLSLDVPSFWLDIHETTAAEFAAFLNVQHDLTLTKEWVLRGAEPLFGLGYAEYSGIEVRSRTFTVVDGFADRPVTMVTWIGAARYCAARGARLPTEAEWEFAARGEVRREHALGAGPLRCSEAVFGRDPGGLRLRDAARPTRSGACADLPTGTQPVMTFPDRTPEGVFGLTGNVREWVHDMWSERLQPARERGPKDGERAIRGCGWNESGFFCRAARRSHDAESYADVAVGFRCARPLSDEEP